jgi:hypothetical protein
LHESGALRSCVKDLIVFAEANAGIRETLLYPAMQRMLEIQMPRIIQGYDAEVCLGWAKFKNGYFNHFGGTMGFIAFVGFQP